MPYAELTWETSAANFTPASLLESNFTGTLFIKKGGVTGPYRKFELFAAAQVTS